MKKNSLTPNKGLSISQAQSISNLCNQGALEIAAQLTVVNNFKKTVKVDKEEKVLVAGKQLPDNVVELLTKKASFHACQAFLMENIKAKDEMLKVTRHVPADVSVVDYPERPEFIDPIVGSLAEVNENFGWAQLSVGENNEYLEAEAFAAHIGQFIHKNGILTGLRAELPNIPAIEWMTIKEGVKSPVNIEVHHKAENLLSLHNDLATAHRGYEQRVNYFKAKVKNLTTKENAHIAKHNADLQNAAAKKNNALQLDFETASKKANEQANDIRAEFEKTRQQKISEIAAMRIKVDSRFQAVISEFLTKLPENQE